MFQAKFFGLLQVKLDLTDSNLICQFDLIFRCRIELLRLQRVGIIETDVNPVVSVPVAYRGSPAPGGQYAWIGVPPPPRISIPLPHRPTRLALGLGVRPPPRLVNLAPPLGKKSTSKKKVFSTKSRKTRVESRKCGALESAGPIAYATYATRLIRGTAKSLYLFD